MGFKEFIIKASLKKSEAGNRNFLAWDKAKTVALILDSSSAPSKNLIDKFIYEADKVVDVYFLDLHSKTTTIKNFVVFTKQEKSLLGLPNKKASSNILNKKYDLLINASFSELDYSCVLSKKISATCKCGSVSRVNELDMVVNRKEGQDVIKYLEEMVNYLKMIKN